MMKRTIIVSLIIVALFSFIPDTGTPNQWNSHLSKSTESPRSSVSNAAISGLGVTSSSTVYMSRNISSQHLEILNSYHRTDLHEITLDLSEYHVPGWILQNTTMVTNKLEAAPEREHVTNGSTIYYDFSIYEHDSFNNFYYDELAQGFYQQAHDGMLVNYSIYYDTPTYNPAQYGYAYFVVRSDYTSSASNLTNPVPIENEFPPAWNTTTAAANLSANTEYYAVIDGSALIEAFGTYPQIRWISNHLAQADFLTRRHDTGSTWSAELLNEAFLNYTYIPWNQTTNQAIVYTNPETISLEANSSSLTGSVWQWTSSSDNITFIEFESNQSVHIHYDLILQYEKDTSASTSWSVESNSPVEWNTTFTLDYPTFSEPTEYFANYSISSDWVTDGLYNSTAPSMNKTSYERLNNVVVMNSMTNGTWTLTSTAPNYVDSVAVYEPSDYSTPITKTLITSTLDVVTLVKDGTGQNATTGSTNLTAVHEWAADWKPTNKTVTDGSTIYSWDISTATPNNGTYTLEVYWTNGTEAGYNSYEIVVYYPTALTPKDSDIAAYVENTFDISVDFNDTYTPKYIDGSYSGVSVVYSFDGGLNASMTDQLNGTWTATIDTTGVIPGDYNVTVYAEGLAIENQTAVIWVTLTYEVQPLIVEWVGPYSNDITYIETTNLTVRYETSTSNITGATVNVTIGTDVWDLTYDVTNEYYWIQFNGTDNPPEFGIHDLLIQAWKEDYTAQSVNTTLTMRVEQTAITASWTSYTIDWTESTILNFNFTDSHGTLVPDADQRQVFINGTEYTLNPYGNGTYWIQIDNSFDLGHHEVYANISKYGYNYTVYSGITFQTNEAVTTIDVSWSPSNVTIGYIYVLNVSLEYQHDGFDVPATATVNVTIDGITYDLMYQNGAWRRSLTGNDLGIGLHTATISAWMYGYEVRTNVTSGINVTVSECPIVVNWVDEQLYYSRQTDLNVTLLDALDQPIAGAVVNASYDGTNYTLAYIGNGVYRLVLNGSDGMDTYPITVYTFRYGFINGTRDLTLEIVETPTSQTTDTEYFGFDSSVETVFFYDGSAEITFSVEDADNIDLIGLIVNLTVDERTYAFTDNSDGSYTLTLTGTEFDPGSYQGTIRADDYGYAGITTAYNIDVLPIPTRIDIIAGSIPTVMFLNDSVLVTFEFYNNHTDTAIDAEIVLSTFEWAGSVLQYTKTDTGRYRVNISSHVLALTDHLFNLTLGLTNYSYTEISQIITVRPVNTILDVIGSYSPYENETATFRVNYTDTDHGVPIYWASINVTIDGVEYTLSYTNDGLYETNVHITIEPRQYSITFDAEAYGCYTNSSTVPLTVREKADVYLDFDLPDSAIEGARIPISAYLRYNDTDQPVVGARVIFTIHTHFDNGTISSTQAVDETNSEGYVSVSFDVPFEDNRVTHITVDAQYEGIESIWRTSHSSAAIPGQLPIDRQVLAWVTSDFGILTMVFLAIVIVSGGYYRKKVKPRRLASQRKLEKQLQDFKDLHGLQHFMAVYLNRGTCVFYHPFTQGRIQPDLISGFIAAITSVYGEIKGDGVTGTLEEITYHGLRLNSFSGKYIIGILILETEMTTLLRNRLQFFVELFEQHYEADLESWMGVMDCFDPEWIVSNLNAAFNYHWMLPHRITDIQKLSKKDAKILEKVVENLDDKGEFYMADVIKPVAEMLGDTEAEALEELLQMADRNVVAPISVHTVLQRQGMGLADTDGEVPIFVEEEIVDEVDAIDDVTELETPEEVSEPVGSEELEPDIGPETVEEEPTDDGDLETPPEEETKEELIVEEELEVAPEPEMPDDEPETTTPESSTTDEQIEEPEPVSDDETSEPEADVDPSDKFIADVEALLKKEEGQEEDD